MNQICIKPRNVFALLPTSGYMPPNVAKEGCPDKSDAKIFGEFLAECMRLGGLSARQVEAQIDNIISHATIRRRTLANSFPDDDEFRAYATWLGIREKDLEKRWRRGAAGALAPVPSIELVSRLLQALSDEEHRDRLNGALSRLSDEVIARLDAIIVGQRADRIANQTARLRAAHHPEIMKKDQRK